MSRAKDKSGRLVTAGDRVRVLEPQPWFSSEPFELVGATLVVLGVLCEWPIGWVLLVRYTRDGRIRARRVIASTVERVAVLRVVHS